MGKTAESIGANTFQYFTRNPRGGAAKAINKKDIAAFLDFTKERGISDFLAHAPYTLNLCSDKENIRDFARNTLEDDIKRVENLPEGLYNFHPGSHVGQGMETGIATIAGALNDILRPDQTVTVLLETMSGKGSEVGGRFEELREIIDRVALREKLGVCLDTCHVFDAGYDIVGDLDGVLTEFDRVIGLERLRAVHINDSKNPLACHKDRHETIGNGHIGLDALARVINHPQLRALPFYLETPNELPGYAAEIKLLKRLYI
jgi:deoxyribonuclease-4